MVEAMIILGALVVLLALQTLCWIIGMQMDKEDDRDRSYLYRHRHSDGVPVCGQDGPPALHSGQKQEGSRG